MGSAAGAACSRLARAEQRACEVQDQDEASFWLSSKAKMFFHLQNLIFINHCCVLDCPPPTIVWFIFLLLQLFNFEEGLMTFLEIEF